MFCYKTFAFAKHTLKQLNLFNHKSLTHIPKNNISIVPIGLQTLINPNVMKLMNLR